METTESPVKRRAEGRGQWKRPIEFILSLVGFCVGMSGVWRFPYLAMRNGGGAFLIPYAVFAVVVGIPLVFMETALGQYFQLSPLLVFNMCPLFKGLGIATTLVSYLGFVYYMVILAWTLYFLAMCFTPVLPWTTCDQSWNTNSCVPLFRESSDNLENMSVIRQFPANVTGTMATEEFWTNNVLQISSGIEEPGRIPLHLFLALMAAYALVYVCIFKGIESSRIAVYITVSAPCLLLLLLLGWLLSRPGSTDGLMFYITPRWERVAHFQPWLEAFLHVFYSMGPGYGGLINLSSFNPFHHNCLRDSVIVVIADITTAIFCGAVVFAGVGCIAHQAGLPVSDVITAGPGLSFITYPHVVASLPVPQLWAVFFFLLILTLGLDSQFAMLKTVTSGLIDLHPRMLRRRQPLLVFGVLTVSMVLSLPFITQGGMYVFQIVDWYLSIFTILTAAFCECIIVGWLYGGERFLGNIREMGNFCPNWCLQFMKICWQFIVPVCMLRFKSTTRPQIEVKGVMKGIEMEEVDGLSKNDEGEVML
ncbi:sodium- and chloride-dependent creatine transporter 1-like [Liolophura sinensis]|uniref:sodium- and chloride-dependent creatine transporter 1-like n=1 Tax=Liolophura sinensis TaxID=3198878 RepID=UPI003158772D